MDAITLLTQDHREVEALFAKFEATNDAFVQAQLAEKICTALTVHMTVEEELFYPKARPILETDDDDYLVDDAEHEHSEAKEMIEEIKTMSTGPELTAAIAELKAAIAHHVADEEEDMFPELEDLGMETTNLGVEMESRKQQLMSTVK